MENLIIILIVVLIAQTVIFIYSNFIDLSNKRDRAAAQEALTNAHADFCNEKKNFGKIIAEKDKAIRELNSNNVKMQAEILERGKRILHLENIVLKPEEQMLIVWRPTLEQIKSVYAAAGVMEQMNEHTDAKNLNKLWEELKKLYQAEGLG